MRAHLEKYLSALRSSYWLVPALLAAAALVLSTAALMADARLGSDWMGEVSWLHRNTPDGTRALLSTIASSMITVAGVTFSITIAAVAYATANLGPRVLRNFMRDRVNQTALGTFVAVYLYCLLVLRTIHGGEEDGSLEAFVPHVAVLLGLVLALVGVGVLIHFFHHLPRSIQATTVIAGIGRDLHAKVQELYPEQLGEGPAGDEEEDPPSPARDGEVVRAPGTGYVQHIDSDGLMQVATEHDLLVHLACRPGDFLTEGDPLAYVHSARPFGDEVGSRICRSVATGHEQTALQDALFPIQQLVEIAARALSTGVNDPFTAMSCLDWLGSGLIALGRRRLPSPYRRDEAGRLRVIAPRPGFAEFLSAVFDQLRPYAAGDRNVALHLMDVLGRVLARLEDGSRRSALLAQAAKFAESAAENLARPEDVATVEEAFRGLPNRRPAPER